MTGDYRFFGKFTVFFSSRGVLFQKPFSWIERGNHKNPSLHLGLALCDDPTRFSRVTAKSHEKRHPLSTYVYSTLTLCIVFQFVDGSVDIHACVTSMETGEILHLLPHGLRDLMTRGAWGRMTHQSFVVKSRDSQFISPGS